MSSFTGLGTTASRKEVKSRRAWTVAEEQNLLLAFRDIIHSGWKSPNGFRTGFIGQLEQRLKVYMPNTDLKGDPNISSKYTSWKKTYFQICTAIGTSGFGWNSSTFTVEAEPEEWPTYLERNPTHACLRGKPFPYYEAWVEIYGKDRATGQGAIDFNTNAQNFSVNPNSPVEASDANSYHPVMVSDEDINPTQDCTQRVSPTENATNTKKSTKRKRNSGGQDQIVEAISELCAATASSFESAVSKMGAKTAATTARKELFNAIGELPFVFNIDEHVDATNAIANNPKTMDAFFGMPTNARIVLVRKVMSGLPK